MVAIPSFWQMVQHVFSSGFQNSQQPKPSPQTLSKTQDTYSQAPAKPAWFGATMRSPALAFAALAIAGCGKDKKDIIDYPEVKPNKDDVTLFPEPGETLCSWQEFTIRYPDDQNVEIESIVYDYGEGPRPILPEGQLPRHNPGEFLVSLNAQEIPASEVSISVTFSQQLAPNQPKYKSTITQSYAVNHIPQPKAFIAKTLPHQNDSDEPHPKDLVTLDFSQSTDSDGQQLTYLWEHKGKQTQGPQMTLERQQWKEDPPTIKILDGICEYYDLVRYSFTGDRILEPFNYKCKGIEIATSGRSWLSPVLQLGPTIPPKPANKPATDKNKVKVDADGKVSLSAYVGYSFEVRAKIKSDANVELKEGQQAAGALSVTVGGMTASKPKTGQLVHKQTHKPFGPKVATPFPAGPLNKNNVAKKTLSDDGNNHHPEISKVNVNTKKGAGFLKSKSKDYVKRGDDDYMVWLDQPGFKISKGTPPAHKTFQALLYAWMSPESCEKYFTVDIAVDAAGVVQKNKLTVIK